MVNDPDGKQRLVGNIASIGIVPSDLHGGRAMLTSTPVHNYLHLGCSQPHRRGVCRVAWHTTSHIIEGGSKASSS